MPNLKNPLKKITPVMYIDGWNDEEISKVTTWLKSEKGKKRVSTVPKQLRKAIEICDSMNIVDTKQLQEHYYLSGA